MFLVSLKCPAQLANSKNDTLLKKWDARLPLDNGGVFVFNRFVVRGDIYVTEKVFVFHPKPYKKGRYGMYNDLVKDILRASLKTRFKFFHVLVYRIFSLQS